MLEENLEEEEGKLEDNDFYNMSLTFLTLVQTETRAVLTDYNFNHLPFALRLLNKKVVY